MKRQSIVTTLLVLGSAASLSGCYVVPIDYRNPPNTASATTSVPQNVALPAQQAVPVTLQARLYPLDSQAGAVGSLAATVVDNLNGHATFSVSYAGEQLLGEASRVSGDNSGFGSIHRAVYGDGRVPTGKRGIASAAGARGTFVNCEYALSSATMGTGVCLFSNGAKYQLHFGG